MNMNHMNWQVQKQNQPKLSFASYKFVRSHQSYCQRTNKRMIDIRPILLFLLLILILFSSLVLTADNVIAVSSIRSDDLTAFDLTNVNRLMIIAPHPDDESLGSAGLIQAVRKNGGEVYVVVVTNGDGLSAGPTFSNYKLLPVSDDYIEYGRERQQETIKALSILGISEDKIFFLGYPDSSLQSIWSSPWIDSNLYGRFTHVSKSPYELTYNKKSIYQGVDLYHDLFQLLTDLQPDLVIVPHPEDTNSDHRAVSNFAQFTVADYESKNSTAIRVFGYLIHYPGYPVSEVTGINSAILPPAALSNNGQKWLNYAIQADEFLLKKTAIKTYKTQQKLRSKYLNSFARTNEIFFELPEIQLPLLAFEQISDFELEQTNNITIYDSVKEGFQKITISGADLVSIQVGRLADKVCLIAETRGHLHKWISYRIFVKLSDGRTFEEKENLNPSLLPDRYFMSCFSLDEMGNPDVIGFSAETWRGSAMIDTTSWHFAILSHPD